MSTEPGQARARSSSPEAERMRLYRKRRREGMRYVRIPLHVTEIDELVRLGFLRGERRQDPEALQAAVMGIIYGVLARGRGNKAVTQTVADQFAEYSYRRGRQTDLRHHAV